MPSLKILDAASVTTFVETFQIASGTTLMASVPINTAGTAIGGLTDAADGLPVFLVGGTATISGALPAGTNALGTVSITQAIPAGTNALGTVSALQSGVWTSVISVAVSTSFAVVAASGAVAPVAVKSAAGTVFGLNLFCTNTTNPVFLRLYNLATGSVNGTSVPNAIFGIPSGGVNNATIPIGGVGFATAISYQITKLGVANDTTAVNASDIVGWITYI